MKIWLLRRRHSDVGGAERFTQRLATALAYRGHDVQIAAERWPVSEDGSYGVLKITSRGPLAYARACMTSVASDRGSLIFSLERTMRQNIFRAGDGVHARWLERRASFQSGMEKLWTSWSSKHRVLLDLEKKVFSTQGTDWVLANSQMVKREILERFPYPEERIRVIYPGVDLSTFKPCLDKNRRDALRKRFGVPKDEVLWVFVGSDFARKGLLWALQIAAAQKVKIWLLVLGKGRPGSYQRLADKLGIGDRLQFAPKGTAALDVYHAADAIVLPTIYDPCSNACLEAAACGLPVITTEANGASELVPGVILKNPALTGECAEACAVHARTLTPEESDSSLQARLDEKPCWDALLKLVDEAGESLR